MVQSFLESGQSDKEIDVGLDTCTIMTSDDVIVGFAIVNMDLLHLIMVAPEHQRKGYGSKLLAHIERQMFQEYPVITLQTFKNNTSAIVFYQKHGWHEAAEQMTDSIDVPMVFFKKSII